MGRERRKTHESCGRTGFFMSTKLILFSMLDHGSDIHCNGFSQDTTLRGLVEKWLNHQAYDYDGLCSNDATCQCKRHSLFTCIRQGNKAPLSCLAGHVTAINGKSTDRIVPGKRGEKDK